MVVLMSLLSMALFFFVLVASPESVLAAPDETHNAASHNCDDAERVQVTFDLLFKENEAGLVWRAKSGGERVEEEGASANATASINGLEICQD